MPRPPPSARPVVRPGPRRGSGRPRPATRAGGAGRRPRPGARLRHRPATPSRSRAAGHDVTGVDLDPAMLARAQRAADAAGTAVAPAGPPGRGRRAHDPPAGCRRLRPGGRSRSTRSSSMGSRADQAAAVATLAAHLAPGGLAMVDAWLPDAEDLARYDGRLVLEWTREDPATGRTVTKSGSAIYEAASSSVVLTTIFEEGAQGEAPVRWVRVDRLRLVTPGRARRVRRGRRARRRDAGRRLRPRSLDGGAERVVMVATRRYGRVRAVPLPAGPDRTFAGGRGVPDRVVESERGRSDSPARRRGRPAGRAVHPRTPDDPGGDQAARRRQRRQQGRSA